MHWPPRTLYNNYTFNISVCVSKIGGDQKGTEKGDKTIKRTKRPNVHGTYGNIIASFSKISTNTGRYDIGL